MRLQRSVRVVERRRLWRSFESIEDGQCDLDDGLTNEHVLAFVKRCKDAMVAGFVCNRIEGFFSTDNHLLGTTCTY